MKDLILLVLLMLLVALVTLVGVIDVSLLMRSYQESPERWGLIGSILFGSGLY